MQRGVFIAHTVAPDTDFCRLCQCGGGARNCRWLGCVAQYHVVCEYFRLGALGLDADIFGAGCGLVGYARSAGRHLGGKIRSIGDVSELHHHASNLLVRRVLLDSQLAELLAKSHAFEPVFLYDRRLSLRLFRRVGRESVAQFEHCFARVGGGLGDGDGTAGAWL